MTNKEAIKIVKTHLLKTFTEAELSVVTNRHEPTEISIVVKKKKKTIVNLKYFGIINPLERTIDDEEQRNHFLSNMTDHIKVEVEKNEQ